MKIRLKNSAFWDYFTVPISAITEGFVKKNVFRVNFVYSFSSPNQEYKAVASYTHAHKYAFLAPITKFWVYACRGAYEDLGRATKNTKLIKVKRDPRAKLQG
jgi:hypothetical protein